MDNENAKLRRSKVERTTTETQVIVDICIDGNGLTNVETTIPFVDHLLISFGKHSRMDINIKAKSIDNIFHHLIEDIGIATAQAIDTALGDRSQINRFGHALIPMDEALSEVSIDLIKRRYVSHNIKLQRDKIENIYQEDLIHFIESFINNINACIHIISRYGNNDHHVIESIFKALAISFKTACKIDKERNSIPSTKGLM